MNKPWVAKAIAAGRQVPAWIAERFDNEKDFEAAMRLRESAFPETLQGGKHNPLRIKRKR